MRPTVVHYIDSEEFGGLERSLHHLLEYHDADRWRAVLFHHGSALHAPLLEIAAQRGVQIRVLPPMTGTRGALLVPAFASALRAERPAVFHAHLNWALGCAWGIIGAAAARVRGIVATVQLFRAVDAMALPFVQRHLVPPLVDRYIAVAAHVASLLRTELGVAGRRITVVPNGVAIERPTGHTPDERANARRRLFGDTDRSVVLTVARLEPQKGHRVLLPLAERIPGALFAVAGAGTLYDGLRAEITERGFGDRILLLGHRDDTHDLLAAADLFLLPSLHEGLPLAILEAMAAGVPVIASAIAGIDEVVEHGVTGLLCAPGDVEAFAAAVRTLLDRPDLRDELTRAAQWRVCEHHTARQMASRIETVYEDLGR